MVVSGEATWIFNIALCKTFDLIERNQTVAALLFATVGQSEGAYIVMGGGPSKQEFRTAILDLVNSNQVCVCVCVRLLVW